MRPGGNPEAAGGDDPLEQWDEGFVPCERGQRNVHLESPGASLPRLLHAPRPGKGGPIILVEVDVEGACIPVKSIHDPVPVMRVHIGVGDALHGTRALEGTVEGNREVIEDAEPARAVRGCVMEPSCRLERMEGVPPEHRVHSPERPAHDPGARVEATGEPRGVPSVQKNRAGPPADVFQSADVSWCMEGLDLFPGCGGAEILEKRGGTCPPRVKEPQGLQQPDGKVPDDLGERMVGAEVITEEPVLPVECEGAARGDLTHAWRDRRKFMYIRDGVGWFVTRVYLDDFLPP